MRLRSELGAVGRAASVFGWVLVVFYLAQQVTMAPNHVDEGFLFESVRLAASGQRVFWDFIDIYGPLNYLGPALFYKLFGWHAIGVRVWVFLVKTSAIVLAYPAVARIADRLSAWLTVAWMTVLLGLPWQALQMPFAFTHCVPLSIATLGLLIAAPFERRSLNLVLAGALTASVFFFKVSTGAFLCAGGLYYCAYWLPGDPSERPSGTPLDSARERAIQRTVLAFFGLSFVYFVRFKVDPLFYFYFDLPVLILVVWTWRQIGSGTSFVPFRARLRAVSEFGAGALACGAVLALGFLGLAGILRYAREMRTLISAMLYQHPLLPLGVPGMYHGFNEYYWMQLPWGISALFVVWASFSGRERARQALRPSFASAGAREAAWLEARAHGAGLFALATLGMFVFYQFGTEVHLLSGLLGAGPCLFVLLYQLRRIGEHWALSRGRPLAAEALPALVAAGVALWLSTIVYRPTLAALAWPQGEWTISRNVGHRPSDNRLAHFRFRSNHAPGVAMFSEALPDHEWDSIMNEACMFVDEITRDGEEVLVLSQDEIIPYHSFTRHVGGRYRLAFFWLRIGLLDREGFDRVVPPNVVEDILKNPPRVVISAVGDTPALLVPLPELGSLLPRYQLARSFGYIQVLVRTDANVAVSP